MWMRKTEAAINRDEGNYEPPHGYYSCSTIVIYFLSVGSFTPQVVFYGPVNKLGVLGENELVAGEATGDILYLQCTQ